MDDLYTRMARRRRRGQGGFTLIELLVVIAVLAILAAIVIFNVTGVTKRGSTEACATDVKTVQTASDAYYNDHAKTYPAMNAPWTGLVPAYMHTAPQTTDGTFAIDGNGTVTASGCP